MEIKITKEEESLKIEKNYRKESLKRINFFLGFYLMIVLIIFLKNKVFISFMIILPISPILYILLLRYISEYSYEVILIKEKKIIFFSSIFYRNLEHNLKNFSENYELVELEKIYFKNTSELFFIRGIKRNESPYCKIHFRFKGNKYRGVGLKITDEEAMKIVEEINNFLEKVKAQSKEKEKI